MCIVRSGIFRALFETYNAYTLVMTAMTIKHLMLVAFPALFTQSMVNDKRIPLIYRGGGGGGRGRDAPASIGDTNSVRSNAERMRKMILLMTH